MVRAGLRIVLHGRALRALVLIELVWGAGMVGVELLSGPRLVELFGNAEQGVTTLGITAALGWSISAVGSSLTGWLVRRTGSPARAGVVTRLAQGVAVAVMAVVAGPVGLVGGYLGFYLVHGAANAVHYGMVHRLVGPEERATVLSVTSLTARVGGTAADLAFGVIAAGAGIGRGVLGVGRPDGRRRPALPRRRPRPPRPGPRDPTRPGPRSWRQPRPRGRQVTGRGDGLWPGAGRPQGSTVAAVRLVDSGGAAVGELPPVSGPVLPTAAAAPSPRPGRARRPDVATPARPATPPVPEADPHIRVTLWCPIHHNVAENRDPNPPAPTA